MPLPSPRRLRPHPVLLRWPAPPDDLACRLPRRPGLPTPRNSDAGLWRDSAVGFRRVPLLPARQAENKKNGEKKSQANGWKKKRAFGCHQTAERGRERLAGSARCAG
ncbi:hypothetical protein VPH35_103472 [Triticum aestivum]